MSDDAAPLTPSRVPTQPAMSAVVPPLTLEERIKSIESYIDGLKVERPQLMSEIRAELASIKAALSAETAKRESDLATERRAREDLSARVTDLVSKVEAIGTETTAQTTMLKVIVKAVDTPVVRKLLLSALASIVIILGVVAAWLKGKADGTPPPKPSVVYVTPARDRDAGLPPGLGWEDIQP